MRSACAFVVLLAAVIASAEVFFEENFDNDEWKDTWVYSTHDDKTSGVFVRTPGKFYHNESDTGIQTSEDAKFYALSRKFEPFSNEGKPLVIQFTVKHEQKIDCGGGYVKVFDCSLEEKDMHGETPYLLMFGPDICGPGTKKVHVIFNYNGKNHLIKKDIPCKDDVYTHLYTLIVTPDNKYKVLIDNEPVESGSLEEDWDFLPAKKIKDPSQSKPADWVDQPTIADPDDKMPDDWEQPQHIPDPEATKPEDWDEEMDGEWEAPVIDNPEYKGEWKPKQIDNPEYKGAWVHPEIDNPEYKPDPELYKKDEVCGIGFDLWQVKSGTIFDKVMITDSPEAASEFATKVLLPTMKGEKKMKEAQDEEEEQKKEPEPKDSDDDEAAMPEEDSADDAEEHDEL